LLSPAPSKRAAVEEKGPGWIKACWMCFSSKSVLQPL
jgi:hypothetical protein